MESRPDAPRTSGPLPCATVLKNVITHAGEAHLPMIVDRIRA